MQSQTVVEFNGKELCLYLHFLFGLRINDATRYIHLAQRCFFGQTAGTQNQVFHTLVVGICKCIRLIHLAVDNHYQVLEFVLSRGNEQLVFVAQFDIIGRAVQYTFQVNRQRQIRPVELHTVQHGAGSRSIFAQAVSRSNKAANGCHVLIQAVESRTEHSTLYLHRVLQSRQDSGYINRVAVHQAERSKIGIADRMNRLCAIVLTHHANGIRICFAAETAGKVQQAIQRLILLHLVVHRALHFAVDAGQSVVGVHNHHIAIFQTHIAIQHTIHQVAVQVNLAEQLVLTEHANLTQRTFVGYTAGHIQRVHHVGKCR